MRERDGTLLAIKMKASTAEGRWRLKKPSVLTMDESVLVECDGGVLAWLSSCKKIVTGGKTQCVDHGRGSVS